MHTKARGCTCIGQNLKETVLWGVPSSRGLKWENKTSKLKRSSSLFLFSTVHWASFCLLGNIFPVILLCSRHTHWWELRGAIGRETRRALFSPLLNPFTARVLDRVLWRDSNFWVCGWNPMMWPFKWKLSARTYTWCYLFFKISQNLVEICFWLNLAVKGLNNADVLVLSPQRI